MIIKHPQSTEKATRLLNQAHKIDDKKEGRSPRLGRPMIPINQSKSSGMQDYRI